MMQLVTLGGAPSILAAVARRYPAADATDAPSQREAVRERVRQAMDAGPFSGRRIVAAVPKELLYVRTVRVPAALPDDDSDRAGSTASAASVALTASVASAASKEAAGLFPFDLRDAVTQFLPAGRVRQGSDVRLEVVILAALRRSLDTFVADLHAAGVVVESLDAEPCALYRSVALPSGSESAVARVLVDVGRRQTQVIIGRGSDIAFIKPIAIGAQHLDQAVSRKLGVSPTEALLVRRRVAGAGGDGDRDTVRQAMSDATRGTVEQLARELALYLRYHAVTFRGPGPEQVYLLGGEADNELLRSSLSALLNLPVAPVDTLARFDAAALSPTARTPAGVWAVAAGLALKKLPQPLRSVNPPVSAA